MEHLRLIAFECAPVRAQYTLQQALAGLAAQAPDGSARQTNAA